MLPAGGPPLTLPVTAVCAARVSPDGNRLSGVRMIPLSASAWPGVLKASGLRCPSGNASQLSYAPVVSAMPRIIGVIWLHVDPTRICVTQLEPHPVVAFVWTWTSVVMPFVASAITAGQSTAARAAGVRAAPARNFAL